MTVGLEVFVHEVIAAIATEPVRIAAAWPWRLTVTGAYSARSGAAATVVGVAGAGASTVVDAANAGGSDAGNDSADDSSTTLPSGRTASSSASASARSPSG